MDKNQLYKPSVHQHYHLVEQAIHFIRQHTDKQPTLSEIATEVNISELQLQHLFSQWAGVSVEYFLQFLSKQARQLALKESANLTDAQQFFSLSDSAKSCGQNITIELMTADEIKRGGEQLSIEYGRISTPFNDALIAWTCRGICYLQFIEDENEDLINDAFN